MGRSSWRCIIRREHQLVTSMTEDEKREVLRRARAIVERGQPQALSRADNDMLEKRRRDMPEHHEPEPEPYREPDAVRARRLAAEHERAWSEWFDNKFDRRIGEERDTVFEIVAQALAQALDEERRDTRQELHEEVKALRTELAEVTTIVGELRQVIASEQARVVDLPPLPLVPRVN